MQLLTLHNLNRYNLFSDPDNNLILRVLFISKSEIKIFLKTDLQNNSLIQVYNHKNEQVFVSEIIFLPEEKNILLKGEFKFTENYFVKINNEQANVILNPEIDGISDTLFYSEDKDFGMQFFENNIRFKLWSPPAVKAELLLFDKNQKPVNTKNPLLLKNTKPGIWEISIDKNYENYFYQYKITAYGKNYMALDPYAKSMAVFDPSGEDKTGKAAIINLNSDKTNPLGFKKNYTNFDFIENETDIIVYEVNVRDFTIMPGTVNPEIAGTFKGFIEKIPYLKELGITHVQLMPVNKAYTQVETDRTYTGKSAKESNYNWGYDPMNYFTPEGRYSTNPYNPCIRIFEFKELIQALHNAGIGVILDVVFNHTYTADTFENVAPGCFYRLNEDFTISGHTGAGASIESRRKQVRKFIIDVLKFWTEEYHIDGFRFDLMSFHDKETMRQIRNEVGHLYNPNNPNELILQGEAWNFTDLKNEAFVKTDFKSLNVGIFNDIFRDALAGNGHSQGFIYGNPKETSRLASAIISGIETYDSNCLPFRKDVFFKPYNLFAKEPSDCLNFISVHDGLTLWDKINLSVKNADKKERLRLMKFAYAVLFTSQGKIILHGGDEILRTKPAADFDKEKHRTLTSEYTDEEESTVYFHENSYCSNDYTNMFRWDRLTNEYSEFANDLLEYVKGLIQLRRNFPAFRFSSSNEINRNIRFINEDCSNKREIHSFKSFKLKKLTLKFINGNQGETLYLSGEIHNIEANPLKNPYVLHFNNLGKAEITFNKNEINQFDLIKWDNTGNLNFKLVKTPGKWDFSAKFYSKFGNNSICPESIDENFEVTIDLSIKDYKKTYSNLNIENKYIAYIIEQREKQHLQNTEYEKFIIIHNASHKTLDMNFKELSELKNPKILIDNKNAGINTIINSDVKIINSNIVLPEKSSVVIAGK